MPRRSLSFRPPSRALRALLAALLVGAILHVLYAEKDKTLAGVANFLSDPRRPVEATLRAMMDTPHLGEAGVHPVIASSARELLNKSENERSGVLSTAMSFLGLYRDPVVARVTARCDWRIADLVGSRQPVTLYLVVPPSDINRTKPLIRLILNQIGRRLTEELTTSGKRHRLLLMLDEFPALGRLGWRKGCVDGFGEPGHGTGGGLDPIVKRNASESRWRSACRSSPRPMGLARSRARSSPRRCRWDFRPPAA